MASEQISTVPAIPFSFFVSLLREISKVPPRRAADHTHRAQITNPSLQIFQRWLCELHRRYSPLPIGTSTSIFRLVFPEDDIRRKYNLRETKLSQLLINCLGVSPIHDRGRALAAWNGELASGCLGTQVMRVLEGTCTSDGSDAVSPLSIAEIDALLDELASTSGYSDPSFRHQRHSSQRPKHAIISALYRDIPPIDASFLTQIILKDLRPVLYPSSETHYTVGLREFNAGSVIMLKRDDALKSWELTGRLFKVSKLKPNIDTAIRDLEIGQSTFAASLIEIPKSVKGRGCSQALQYFTRSSKIWAETKYDGERAQIHVEIQEDGGSRITIFSKSKRDSTLDRYGIHHIIRRALRLPHTSGIASNSDVKCNVVLDAEMVAFSDRLNGIDEFWRIRSLIEGTARGIRRSRTCPSDDYGTAASQCSLISNGSDHGTRHLALVFFDVLFLDSISLLANPYSTRRSVLEKVIQPIQGQAMLAERMPISLDCNTHAENDLRQVFAKTIADHQEGIVLKADESRYSDFRLPWVKLKKDYIPGYGDTLDLVILGAAWDKHRSRELRVSPNTYTTFYVGVLGNDTALKADPLVQPHFEVYFVVSYGLGREQLEELNFLVKNSDPVRYSSRMQSDELSYTINLRCSLAAPAILFRDPLLAEVFGAGFTKALSNKYYELRFPRIAKVFRKGERMWSEGISLQELHRIARETIGRDRSHKDLDDWCNDLWGKPTSPGAKSASKRKTTEEMWVQRLIRADKKTRKDSTLAAPPVAAPPVVSTVGNAPENHNSNMLSTSPTRSLQPLRSTINAEEHNQCPPGSTERMQTVQGRGDSRRKDTPPPSVPNNNTVIQESFVFISPTARAAGQSLPHISTSSLTEATSRGETLVPADQSAHGTPAPFVGKAQRTSQSTLAKLLDNALVWIAKPRDATRLSWRCPLKDILPSVDRIHSLDSLLLGCGWHTERTTTCGWVERGVILVNNDPEDNNSWRNHILKVLGERRAISSAARKPIWILDSRLLCNDRDALGEDIEDHVLCRLE